ncbi:MAG TPA: DUF433 domain-containing protein [Methyloceanibacter sp.]|nr:DUF433 domain-containing protein [Methyloceanibacter sp.]
MLAGGATRADILRDYPYLEDEDIARRSSSRRGRAIIPSSGPHRECAS